MSNQNRFRKIAQIDIKNEDIAELLKNIPIDETPEAPVTPKAPSNTPDTSNQTQSNDGRLRKETDEDPMKKVKDALKTIFDIDSGDMASFKESIPYLLAFFQASPSEKFRYSPKAFKSVLEKNKHKGYKNTSVSEGAFQPTDPNILKEVEKFRKKPPTDLKDFRTKEPVKLDNINVPSSSGRYKSMRSKLYGKSAEDQSSDFIKTSQNTQVNDFNKLLPEWDISDVLKSMSSVANKTDIADAEKQQSMINILSQYEKSIAPLSQFLDKNDIKYK
jgi:hypothetical protein